MSIIIVSNITSSHILIAFIISITIAVIIAHPAQPRAAPERNRQGSPRAQPPGQTQSAASSLGMFSFGSF